MSESPYTDVILEGEPLTLAEWLRQRWSIFAVLLGLLLLGAWAVYVLLERTRVEALPDVDAMPVADAAPEVLDLTIARGFQQAYLAANGGMELLSVLESVRLIGAMDIGGQQRPFYAMRKRPNWLLLSVEMDQHELTYGIDDTRAWQRVRVRGQEDVVTVLEGAAADAVLSIRSFLGPLMRFFLLGEGELQGIEAIEHAGRPYLQVQLITSAAGRAMEFWVDPETLQPQLSYERFTDGRVRKTVYGDYHSLHGMQEPFLIQTYIDEVLEDQIIVEAGASNVGPMPWLFDVPDDWHRGSLISEWLRGMVTANFCLKEETMVDYRNLSSSLYVE